MSSFHTARLRCRCGHDHTVEVADGLHISLRPDIRQSILDGTFHRFTCPACETVTLIEELLSYTDFPRRHWFTVVPRSGVHHAREWLEVAHQSFRATMVERAAPMVKEWAPAMHQRLIFGLASLREKLAIFDAGLDDRIMELVKLRMLGALGRMPRAEDHFHLSGIEDAVLVFELGHPDGGVTELPVPRALYQQISYEGDAVRGACPALFDDIAVDYRVGFEPEEHPHAS